LAGKIKECSILLDDKRNKIALHTECHKLKTIIDNKLIISKIRQTRKQLKGQDSLVDDSNLNLMVVTKIIKDKQILDDYLKEIKDIYSEDNIKAVNAILKKFNGIVEKLNFVTRI
jgi:hypothetical protein